MKVKVGDKVTTDAGDGEIVFIGTQLVVYRNEAGDEWTEYGYEQTAVVPCEIDFMKVPEKKKEKK
jgi:hypothetical protein